MCLICRTLAIQSVLSNSYLSTIALLSCYLDGVHAIYYYKPRDYILKGALQTLILQNKQ